MKKETLVDRYGICFGAGKADCTSEEERRVRAKIGPSPSSGLIGCFMGTLQCIAKGRDAIVAAGPPDPARDLPSVSRDKQMLQRALSDFDAFQEEYGRLAPAVWNRINEACAHAPQMVELNTWLRQCPAVRSEMVHQYQPPPTGPRPLNVLTSEPLFGGYPYTCLTFDAKQACVWATYSEADHLLLLHGLYHFWRYAEYVIDTQIALDRAIIRVGGGEESFYVMWQRWMGKTDMNTYSNATPFGKNVIHLRRILAGALAAAGALDNKAK